MVRQGLRSLLTAEPDIEVVGEAANGRQAIQLARELQPDVVVMDIGMPLLNGLEATRQIIHENRQSRLLVLSGYADDEYVRQLAEAGASGYLIKQTAAQELIKAVREVAKGNAYFSPSILKRLLEFYRDAQGRERPSAPQLTSREQEVLQLVAEGQVNKQIAADAGPRHEDGRKAPPAADGQAQPAQHCRAHPLRARPWHRGKHDAPAGIRRRAGRGGGRGRDARRRPPSGRRPRRPSWRGHRPG